jgi:hypothetical protein
VAPETWPAIVAVEEAGIERGRQAGMPAEIADGAQAQPRGRVSAHGEGVRVGEAERLADDQAARLHPRAQRRHIGHRRIVENGAADRARVFRVDVDIAAGQRAVDDARPAQAEPSLNRRFADLLGDPGHDLGDDVALGERFGAHANRGRAALGGPGEHRHAGHEQRGQSTTPEATGPVLRGGLRRQDRHGSLSLDEGEGWGEGACLFAHNPG